MLAFTLLGSILLPLACCLTSLDYFYQKEMYPSLHSNNYYHSQGLAPLIYMQIAEDTYKPDCDLCKRGFMDFQFEELLVEDREDGFFGRTYLVTDLFNNHSEVVISFRGTDDLSDVFQDLLLIINSKTSQFESSEAYFRRAYNMFAGVYEISLTGHSLGGCFAYVEARKSNNMAVLFDNPGCEPFLPPGNWSDSCPLITQYVKNPNLINNLGYSTFCGETFRIAPCGQMDNYKWLRFWKDNSYNIHLAMVVYSFFSVNPLFFLMKTAVFFVLNREISSVLEGHLLLDYQNLFDNKTGAPILFEKVNHDSWRSYFSGYSCLLGVVRSKKDDDLGFTPDPFMDISAFNTVFEYSNDGNHDLDDGFSYEFDWVTEDLPLLTMLIAFHLLTEVIPKLRIKHKASSRALAPSGWLDLGRYEVNLNDVLKTPLLDKFRRVPKTMINRFVNKTLGDKSAMKIRKSGRLVRETLKSSLF